MTSLAEALALFRRGDAAGARKIGERLLKAAPGNPRLLEFVGVMRCQTGDGAKGIAALRKAAAALPDDPGVRQNVVQSLTDLGRLAEAEAACAAASSLPDPGERRVRLHAWLLQTLGRQAEASKLYEAIVARAPDDAQSWNNLGNARRAIGDVSGAVTALGEAARHAPGDPQIRLNLAAALSEAGDEEAALKALDSFTGPRDPDFALRRADLLAALSRIEEAERAYRDLIAARPDLAPAWFGLGLLLEHGGRGEALPALLADAAAAGVADESLSLIQAYRLRREERLEEALAAAEAAPPEVEPTRRLQLIGEMNDRLGRAGAAWDAFAAMNAAAGDASARDGAARYRAEVARIAEIVTPAWPASWSPPAAAPSRPQPIFLLGFPRSGTTLLDTMLMGEESLLVLEERPLWNAVIEAVPDAAALASLSEADIERLRALYFAAIDAHAPGGAAGNLVPVDKMPLNLARVPWLHRLFPEARYVLSLRHPADAVLSCLFTNFRLNYAMANFLELGDAAATYDLVMRAWEKSRAAFALPAHAIRYEDLIASPEETLRPLFDFLGLAWRDGAADHRAAARARGYVASASYAQVTEPLYRRAAGRWERYRDRLGPALRLLAPWAERYGYTL